MSEIGRLSPSGMYKTPLASTKFLNAWNFVFWRWIDGPVIETGRLLLNI